MMARCSPGLPILWATGSKPGVTCTGRCRKYSARASMTICSFTSTPGVPFQRGSVSCLDLDGRSPFVAQQRTRSLPESALGSALRSAVRGQGSGVSAGGQG